MPTMRRIDTPCGSRGSNKRVARGFFENAVLSFEKGASHFLLKFLGKVDWFGSIGKQTTAISTEEHINVYDSRVGLC